MQPYARQRLNFDGNSQLSGPVFLFYIGLRFLGGSLGFHGYTVYSSILKGKKHFLQYRCVTFWIK